MQKTFPALRQSLLQEGSSMTQLRGHKRNLSPDPPLALNPGPESVNTRGHTRATNPRGTVGALQSSRASTSGVNSLHKHVSIANQRIFRAQPHRSLTSVSHLMRVWPTYIQINTHIFWVQPHRSLTSVSRLMRVWPTYICPPTHSNTTTAVQSVAPGTPSQEASDEPSRGTGGGHADGVGGRLQIYIWPST